ncbi:SET domain-containing protein-lysine N-methyltransferase [Flavobacterium sp.]|uniref:SET domain-containing protein-lysine N-methyltransferase n=1 Tax=Flavobacterium sp. TaxID=239 RepID=UPI003752929D
MKADINKINASESDYLYTNPSQITNSGTGLYTAITIYKDEIIAIYKGKILNKNEAKAKADKGKDKYFINLLDGTILDSITIKCFAKYANDATGFSKSDFKNNAKIGLDENENVCLIATRKIKQGEEVFCNYGKRYWNKHK